MDFSFINGLFDTLLGLGEETILKQALDNEAQHQLFQTTALEIYTQIMPDRKSEIQQFYKQDNLDNIFLEIVKVYNKNPQLFSSSGVHSKMNDYSEYFSEFKKSNSAEFASGSPAAMLNEIALKLRSEISL